MGIEVATYLSSLNSSNPAGGDDRSQGDDHLRLLKNVLKTTFPNADRIFRFPSSAGSQSGTVTLAESTGHNKLFPAVGNTTFNLPNAPSDGCTFYVIKTDDNTDPVTLDAFSTVLINAAETYVLTKRYQGVKVVYCSTLTIWLALPWFPVAPYYSGGQDIPFSDLVQVSEPRRLLGLNGDIDGAAADIAELTLDQILDWLLDSGEDDPVEGSIPYRGTAGWFSAPPGTDGQVWRTKGAGEIPIWGDPIRPATAYAEYTTPGTLLAHIPLDNTIPDISEGAQIFTLSITPKRSTSRIRVRVEGTFASSGAGSTMALFKDGASPAVRARHVAQATGGEPDYLSLVYEFAPGSVNTINFTVRVGVSGGSDGTLRASGNTSAAYHGGVECPTMTIEELFQ